MGKTQVKTFGVPDKLCQQVGIAGTWVSANTLSTYAPNHDQKVPRTATYPTRVHHIRPEVVLFDPILRKLVNESNGIFYTVQQCDVANKSQTPLLNLSRQYRSIIKACLENLQDQVENGKSVADREKYSSYVTIFYSVECVWHLCEILYVEQIPGDVVLNHLLEWVRFHFPKHERNASKLLSGSLLSGAEVHPKYWETVIGVFMQGRIDVTRALLKLHTASDSIPFKTADHVLKSLPTYNAYGGVAIVDFQLRWTHWQMDTQTKIDSKAFTTQQNLELIMKLAVGDTEMWEAEGMSRCEAWYEYLASRLLFSEPFVKRSDLGSLATRCIQMWPHPTRHLDSTLLALMQQDLHKVTHEIQQMSENGWFAAHMIDILYQCGALTVLDEQKLNVSRAIRDALVQDYGTMLMGHHSLWQVGVVYLSKCHKLGLHRLKLLLERIPLKSEKRSLKLIQIAQNYGFLDIKASICKQRAMLAVNRNRSGHALGWALRSRDSALSSHLADILLRKYCSNGSLQSTDLLDSLGSAMLVSDRLIFLGKYFEFHKVYRNRNFKEAASLLIALLASKITPKYFWGTLFTDALPLLESDEIVLSSNDTYELLHNVEQHGKDPALQEKIGLIRLASARNLARALTHEIQIQVQ